MSALINFYGFLSSLFAGFNIATAGSEAKKYSEQVAENIKNNLEPSLILLVTGMVGIFVVMIILMIVIFILSKTTKDQKDDNDK